MEPFTNFAIHKYDKYYYLKYDDHIDLDKMRINDNINWTIYNKDSLIYNDNYTAEYESEEEEENDDDEEEEIDDKNKNKNKHKNKNKDDEDEDGVINYELEEVIGRKSIM